MQRILIGNIKGPQGAQGIQGPQGPVGATGPQGPMPDLVNNALATEAGVAALDAVMGKTLQDQITDLNSNFIKFIEYTVTDSVTIESLKGESWNVNSVIPEGYRVMCCNLVYGTSSTTGAIAQLLTDIVNDNLIVCFNKYSNALTFSSLTFRIYVIKK